MTQKIELEKMREALDAELVVGSKEGKLISGAYTSDLLSDVMAKAPEGCALITIQAHRNTAAVASVVGAEAIVICNSRPLPPDFSEACRQEDIALLLTSLNQFETSARVHALLHGAS